MLCLANSRSSLSSLATSARQIHASAITAASPRSPLEKLGNIVIPSREEVLKKSGRGGYVPDLTYLKDAPDNSLASKLLRSATGQSEIPPTATVTQPAPSKVQRQQLEDQRRQQRLARELGNNRISDNAAKLQAAASASRETIFKAGVSRLAPGEYQQVTKSPERIRKERNARTDKPGSNNRSQPHRNAKASGNNAPRKQDHKKGGVTQGNKQSARKAREDTAVAVDEENEDDYAYEEFEDDGGSCLPNFPGPQEVSTHLYDVLRPNPEQANAFLATPNGKFRIPSNLVSSFTKRSYAGHVPFADEMFAQTPKQLGPAKEAQVLLSHNPHYTIPHREHTLRIVENAVSIQARVKAAAA